MNNRLIKSNDAGGGACTNTVDLYNPFPDGGGVALYQLNGDATDVSGNYDGTATNVTYGAGQFGQAGVFNGSSSKVVLDYSALRGTTLSVSLWFKTTSSGFSAIIDSQAASSSSKGFGLYLLSNGTLELGFSGGSGSNKTQTSLSYNDGLWHNATIVFNLSNSGNNAFLYIDNNLVITLAVTVWTSGDSTYPIALGVAQTNYFFNGSIDQVRVFSRALRPYEVEALYTEEYCTPTIVPSEHFNTVTYTGDGSSKSITDVGFQPDLVWIKPRSAVQNHFLFDSVRGENARGFYLQLCSNTDETETDRDTSAFENPYGGLTSLDSTGFTVQHGSSTVAYPYYGDNNDYVAWNFKAGGAAVANTDGTITSQVSANTEAGFSIVSYTGNGSTTGTVGHGLGTIPSVFIVKERTATSTSDVWGVHFVTENLIAFLNLTNAAGDGTIGGTNGGFATNQTTDSTLQFITGWNSNNNFNNNGSNYITYCFAEVEGFSNFGSYVGTETSQGIVTGFEPAFVMIKCSSVGGTSWLMFDNKRVGTNKPYLLADSNAAEDERASNDIRFLNNGFELLGGGGGVNNGGDSYIYMAFAADPTTIEPSLEDSFNTVLYTGNGSTQSVTGVGFQPDLVWFKGRDFQSNNALYDSLRGVGNYLVSNSTIAEGYVNNSLQSFNADGFTIGSNTGENNNGNSFVAWNWKGAELPAINSNGSIPSVVSANPAAGFSIVSHNGTGGVGTVGHGLDSAPKIIIRKGRDGATDWWVYISETYPDFGYLNYTDAFGSESNAAYAFNQSNVTDSVFSVGNTYSGNINNNKYIAYCFAEVAGFSKFGSHTGNGGTKSINVGFEPAFVISKITSSLDNWRIYDNKRSPFGQLQDEVLLANGSQSEYVNDPQYIEFTSTGFNLFNNANNLSGETYIYMAFANQF